MSDIKYLVVVNRAAHSGTVIEVDMNEAWSNSNPDGWTNQEITGAHGEIYSEWDVEEDANKELESYLVCPAAEEGLYCFTHNPDGERP